MKYICLDTNIYLDAVFDRHQNQYTEILNAIRELLDDNKIKVILPEIIKFEFLRHYNEEILIMKRNISEIKNQISKMPYPLKLREYRKDTIDSLSKMLNNFNEEDNKFETTEVFKIFNHLNTIEIPLNDNILLKAYKRSFLKLKPNGDEFLSGDNTIVESLIYYSDKNDKLEIDLLSRNYKDFGSGKDNKGQIHKDLEEEFKLNNINYVYEILKYMHTLNKVQNITELPEIEKQMFFIVCPRCRYVGDSEWENACPKCNYVWCE